MHPLHSWKRFWKPKLQPRPRRGRAALLGGAGLAALTLTAVHAAPAPSGSAGQAATVAAMAERLYPSGAPAVVISSGLPGHYADLAAAQALAMRVGGPVLLAAGVDTLGTATQAALTALTVPRVSNHVQPVQPPAGKPTVYLVGGPAAIGQGVAQALRNQGYTVIRVGGNSRRATLEAVAARVAPPWPQAARRPGFPAAWDGYVGNPEHNAVFAVPASAPAWERNGVTWRLPEADAVPLSAPFPDLTQLGARGAPVKMTQTIGNAVGVTAVNGVIYAESDDGHLYAVDARNGRLLWEAGPTVNALMGNPVVADGLVFVTAGDTGFPFSQVLKFFLSQGKQPLVRGLGYAAVYAYNAHTGRLVWRHDFHGNAMPTPLAWDGTLYVPTGGGNLWAFDARTGQLRWKTYLGGFDSMSSPNLWTNPATGQTEIIVGTSDANHVVAVDARTGKVLWTQATTLPIFNTGMGDNSPAVDPGRGIVSQDSVIGFDPADHTVNLAIYALNAATGRMLWATKLGRGPAVPAYKAGVAMIHGGVVYVGSPVTSTLYALNEQT
ncbi:MAG: PQQ-binding-like beta-propeller repeat protein, partial [Firmicutes bacterium]|nr:PQQ-binding-like beta-propeller repeat protein [Bacillota bacterium]